MFADFSFSDVSHDLEKFAGNRSFGSSLARAGLTWDDVRSIQQVENKPRCQRWIPDWVFSTEKLKAVIQARAQYHVRSTSWIYPTQPYQLKMLIMHQSAIARAGSYEAMLAVIAWRSFRLGWTSTAISESLGGTVTPTGVRQHVFRLRQAARKLGFEDKSVARINNYGQKLSRKRLLALRLRHANSVLCGWCKERQALPNRTRCEVCRDVNRAYRAGRNIRKSH